MTQIKICGLSRLSDIDIVNELKPDYIGFMFYKKSKRYISPGLALILKRHLDPVVKAVGVFLDEPLENVIAIARTGCIDLIQLHGHENEAYMAALRREVAMPIIRAFVIEQPEENTLTVAPASLPNPLTKKGTDVKTICASSADILLVDSGFGGTGRTFDWSLLSDMTRPYLLAGGLDPENVSAAVTLVRPLGVDVSSGVESNGVKDPEKIRRFIENVRSCHV